MGNNAISLKSRFQNAKGARAKADLGSHPKTASTHNLPANRVEKLTSGVRKRRSHNEITLTDRFKDSIDTYRTELGSETDRLLAQTEHDLDQQLAEITQEFGGQLRLVADFESKIFSPISEERLEIVVGSAEEGGQTSVQYATLADRMRDLERVLSAEAAQLESLWKEWYATNLELVRLAVEVLGPVGVKASRNQDDKSLTAQVTAAIDENRGHEARHTEYQKKAAEMERSIRATAREAINHLTEQEKEWRITEKKKIQKIKQIIMEAD
ncbi:hypothetical protein EPUS_02461 [Endocarpon pusillum Z07020]|uniref:Uncharacterized protein n=1 Tax=Endocarpon pusillum (strain Z07020 / HMAS-L-300199) TaxID=1263415 RepID=U1HK30_ENDPU|nr:uncharacterized protein EPUS_02461 [Endocarpon pusillum Z07020]ERF70595.1 hypothetical protein EPUS_02461 [Endocarpon pusillum Z07020]